jgi:hypothetical protein
MTTKTKKVKEPKVKFDYKKITSFETACEAEGIDPKLLPDVSMLPEQFRKPIIAGYILMVAFKAINQDWKPDWSNWNENKYFPWFRVLSSGFGFSGTDYNCANADAYVGSRLCTNSSEKALHIAKYFEAEYKDFMLYTE